MSTLTPQQAQDNLERAIMDYAHARGITPDAVPTGWILVGAVDHLDDPGVTSAFTAVMSDSLPQHIQLGLLEYAAARCRKRIMEDGQ